VKKDAKLFDEAIAVFWEERTDRPWYFRRVLSTLSRAEHKEMQIRIPWESQTRRIAEGMNVKGNRLAMS
jgi:hypothetical protein